MKTTLLLGLLLLTPLCAQAQSRRQALSINISVDQAVNHITTVDVASGILDRYDMRVPTVAYSVHYQNGPLDSVNGWGWRVAYLLHRYVLPDVNGNIGSHRDYRRATSPVLMLGPYYQWYVGKGVSMRLSSMFGVSNLFLTGDAIFRERSEHRPQENRTVYFRSLTSQIQPFSQLHFEITKQLNRRWELGLYGHVSGNYLRRDQYELRIDHQADSRPDAPVVRREWARTQIESGGLGLNLTYRIGLGRRNRQV